MVKSFAVRRPKQGAPTVVFYCERIKTGRIKFGYPFSEMKETIHKALQINTFIIYSIEKYKNPISWIELSTGGMGNRYCDDYLRRNRGGSRTTMQTDHGEKTQALGHFRASWSDDIHTQAAMLDTWHQEYSQISAGHFAGAVQSAEVSGFRLFSEQMNRAVFQKGLVKSGGLGFGVIVNSKGKAMICGERAAKRNLIVFSGKEGFEFFSPEKFKFVGVEIQKRDEETPQLQYLLRDLKEKLDTGPRSLELGDKEVCNLSQSLLHALDLLERSPAKHNNMNALKRQVVGSMLDLITASELDQNRETQSASHYWSVICNTRDLVFANPECPLSVSELALHLNLSTRSIQTACRQTLGISPKAYLRALRLSEVRREIVFSNTVSEAATRWGFWHFGYFSRDYRSMFGELPSATLARAR